MTPVWTANGRGDRGVVAEGPVGARWAGRSRLFRYEVRFASGILLLHRHPLGYATVAGQLVWLGLTSVPILVTPLVANARGHDAAWAVTFPISALLLGVLTILGRVLQHAADRPAASEGQIQ
jgi:hypothetical protein